MATKPTFKPFWANNAENDPITNAPNKSQPTSELQASGLKRKEPFFRSHLNWMFDNIARWIDYLDTVNSTISVNTTIYVATTGDDVTGDGSILSPFATPQRALESLIGVPIATNALVTIFCAAGVYNFTESLKLNHPYGERIHIIGDNLAGVKPTKGIVADWSLDKTNPTVPARTANQFYSTSAGLPVNADQATRRSALVSDLNNNLTLVEERFSTVFKWTGSSGVVVDGNNSLGKIDKIALVGDWDGTFADPTTFTVGVDLGRSEFLSGYGTSQNVTGGSLYLGKDTVVIGWYGEGLRVRYGSSLTSEDSISVVNNYNMGARVEGSSVLSANTSTFLGNGNHGAFVAGSSACYLGDSYTSGNMGNGVQGNIASSVTFRDSFTAGNGFSGVSASVGSSISARNVDAVGNGGDGISSVNSSMIDALNVESLYNNNRGLYALNTSTIAADSSTVKGNGIGLDSSDNSTITIKNSTLENNTTTVISQKRSYVNMSSTPLTSGDVITAERYSYIIAPNTAGVVYSPTYGTISSDGSLIGG